MTGVFVKRVMEVGKSRNVLVHAVQPEKFSEYMTREDSAINGYEGCRVVLMIKFL
jgi:hypothetical protein